MIRLFLYDSFENFLKEYEVELKDDIQVSISKQFTDLTNPTSIRNDWSKTISIPFTLKNNEIFGCLFRADREVTSYAPVGQFDFDASKKVQFRLFNNDYNLIMTGYMKVLNVEQKSSAVGSYNVSLNGELGRIFQIMKTITLDNNKEIEEGYIDGKQYIYESINANLIKRCWEKELNDLDPSIATVESESYDVTNYIGFIPNNAFTEGYDYKSYEFLLSNPDPYFLPADFTHFDTFENELQHKWDNDNFTLYKADLVLSDGLTSRGISEFRSYLLTPFIFFHKLFGIFCNKVLEMTGYKIQYNDNSWFNQANDLWFKQVFCLNNFNLQKDESEMKAYEMQTEVFQYTDANKNIEQSLIYKSHRGTLPPYNTYQNGFDLTNGSWNFDGSSTFKIRFAATTTTEITDPNLYFKNCFAFSVDYSDFNGNLIRSENFAVIPSNYEALRPTPAGYKRITTNDFEYWSSAERSYAYIYADIPIPLPLLNGIFGNNVKISIRGAWTYNENMFSFPADQCNIVFTGNWKIFKQPQRSFTKFSLNDIWNNDYNLFDIILNYCKKYRIFIEVDDLNKTINFTQAKQYFQNYTIEDWSNKIDYSKSWKLEPYVAESKYLLFNYDNNETKINKIYKLDTGFNYGELRAETDFVFNNETKNLFSGLKTGLIYKSNYRPWDWLYELRNITSTTSEAFACNAGDDNKQLSMFGQNFIWKGRTAFTYTDDPHYEHRPISITDDTMKQILNDTYCFNLTPEKLDCSTLYYTKLSILNQEQNLLITFGRPAKTYGEQLPAPANSVYVTFWSDYLKDLYDINTKRITCYARLNDTDFRNFKFNKFIQINNNLYFVNKISDYLLSSAESTKIEVVSINNINNYINPKLFYWTVAYPHNKTLNITGFPTTIDFEIVGTGINNINFEVTGIDATLGLEVSWEIEKRSDYLQTLSISVDYPSAIRPGQTFNIAAGIRPIYVIQKYEPINITLNIVE